MRCTRSRWAGPRPSTAAALSGSSRHRRDERVEQRRTGRGEGRRGQRGEVEGLAATGSGLALAGRQQDQHGRKRRERRAVAPRLGSGHAQQPCGEGPLQRGQRDGAGDARRHRRDPGGARASRRRSPRPSSGRPPRRPRAPAARARPHRHPVRHDRPRVGPRPRPGDAHRARRATATSCTTRSPTSRPSSRRATPSTSRPTAAARRSTAPTPRSRCTRPVLSEGAASLLPDEVRPALLWTIKVDETGEGTDVEVERALVRSRAKLSYDGVQADLDAGQRRRAHRPAAGGRRAAPRPRGRPRRRLAAAARAGARRDRRRALGAGVPAAARRSRRWNAQISLLTGMAAASLMVYARVGILRTLPPADPRDVQRLHRTARALGIDVARRAALPRLHPHARPVEADPRRDDRGVHAAAARRGLRHLQRRAARAGPALRARLGVRPRHRAAAPARRPLRRRGLRRAVRRHRGARRGSSRRWPSCPTR